jgi:tetratricopeptide (TPR) repeat protein
MTRLGLPDVHFLLGAVGWLELGNHQEAALELDRVAPGLQGHPDVLEVRWRIFIAAKKPVAAQAIAQELIKLVPDQQGSWCKLAQSHYYQGHYQDAYDSLIQVLDRFPKDYEPPYDMACYACLLGHMDEARSYLRRAFTLNESKKVKLMALQDKDLEPLWEEIAALVVKDHKPEKPGLGE